MLSLCRFNKYSIRPNISVHFDVVWDNFSNLDTLNGPGIVRNKVSAPK